MPRDVRSFTLLSLGLVTFGPVTKQFIMVGAYGKGSKSPYNSQETEVRKTVAEISTPFSRAAFLCDGWFWHQQDWIKRCWSLVELVFICEGVSREGWCVGQCFGSRAWMCLSLAPVLVDQMGNQKNVMCFWLRALSLRVHVLLLWPLLPSDSSSL